MRYLFTGKAEIREDILEDAVRGDMCAVDNSTGSTQKNAKQHTDSRYMPLSQADIAQRGRVASQKFRGEGAGASVREDSYLFFGVGLRPHQLARRW